MVVGVGVGVCGCVCVWVCVKEKYVNIGEKTEHHQNKIML